MQSLLATIQASDHRLFVRLQGYHGWLARYCRAISRTADGHLYVAVALLGAGIDQLYPDVGLQPFVQLVCICFLLERPIYFVLKNTCRRRRPPEALPDFKSLVKAADKFSFPSGHTSAAFMFSTCCLLGFGPVALPLFAWASTVALSRIFLGVHFPSDVLIGAFMGGTIALHAAYFLT